MLAEASGLFGTVCNGGPSDLVDPAAWPIIGLLNPGFGSILLNFPRRKSAKHRVHSIFCETEYERAKVLPYNGNDPRPPLVVYKPFCFHSIKRSTKQVEARGASEVRRGTSSIPFLAQHLGCPVIFGMDFLIRTPEIY